jgi:hypothetical protein
MAINAIFISSIIVQNKRLRSHALSSKTSHLGDSELGGNAHDAEVLLVRVLLAQCVVHAEVDATVRDDTNDGNAETAPNKPPALSDGPAQRGTRRYRTSAVPPHPHTPVVETQDTLGAAGRLDQAVAQAVEVTLARADIRRQTRTRVVERVDDSLSTKQACMSPRHTDVRAANRTPRRPGTTTYPCAYQGAGASETARGHVDQEELAELLVGVDLGEQLLDRVLEGEVERLRTRERKKAIVDQNHASGCTSNIVHILQHAQPHAWVGK